MCKKRAQNPTWKRNKPQPTKPQNCSLAVRPYFSPFRVLSVCFIWADNFSIFGETFSHFEMRWEKMQIQTKRKSPSFRHSFRIKWRAGQFQVCATHLNFKMTFREENKRCTLTTPRLPRSGSRGRWWRRPWLLRRPGFAPGSSLPGPRTGRSSPLRQATSPTRTSPTSHPNHLSVHKPERSRFRLRTQ